MPSLQQGEGVEVEMEEQALLTGVAVGMVALWAVAVTIQSMP